MNDARVIPRSRAALGDLTQAQVDDTPPRGAYTEASRSRLALEATMGRGPKRGKSEGPQLCCNSPLLLVSVELVDASHPCPDCSSQRP